MKREEAIARAQAVADQEGWTWLEPVHAALTADEESGRHAWSVASNFLAVGCSVHVVLDARTGEVLRKNYSPR